MEITFTASGTVDEYDTPERRQRILADVLALAGMNISSPGHTLTVKAASVSIAITLRLTSLKQGTRVRAALSASFSTAGAASAALDMVILSTPTLTLSMGDGGAAADGVEEGLFVDGGAAASLASSGRGGADSTGVIIGCSVAAALCAAIAISATYLYCRLRWKTRGGVGGRSPRARTIPDAIAGAQVLATPIQLPVSLVGSTLPSSCSATSHQQPGSASYTHNSFGSVAGTSSTASGPYLGNPFMDLPADNPFSHPIPAYSSDVEYKESGSPGASPGSSSAARAAAGESSDASVADATAFQMRI